MATADRIARAGIATTTAVILAEEINGAVAADAGVVALTPLTVTATTGTLPTPEGTVTIANAAAPTVTELQEFCVELNAKLNALVTALKS